MDAVALLLTTAFRHVINEPNDEAGYERFAALTNGAVDETAFRMAVATALRDGLIHEPIRLPEGGLAMPLAVGVDPAGRHGGEPSCRNIRKFTRYY